MPRNGLSKEKLVAAAAAIIEQSGTANFSMRVLAENLNVKTASLYNHVESMDDLIINTCAYALQMQYEMEIAAIGEKSGTDAIIALATAYRRFAKEHCQLYRLIMSTAASCGEQFNKISECIIEPFFKVLEYMPLTNEEKCHWQRVLRGIVHGFVSQEDAGFFSHLPTDVEDSFKIAIQCYIDGLTQAERRKLQ